MCDIVNKAIQSGDYRIILDAIKGFRNGCVYGVKIRAPHALLMTTLWNKGTPKEKLIRIYKATKFHALHLGTFAFLFKLIKAILHKVKIDKKCSDKGLNILIAGAVAGGICWGDNNPVVTQINMYVLSRLLSAYLFFLLKKIKFVMPPYAMRLYAGVLWGGMMYMFYEDSSVLQKSLQTSMEYIYVDSDKYNNVQDLLIKNKPDQI